ncbi:MAG: anti-sigma regulatory factor [Clostridiales bacterium]|nr:anti-sigma regulatory factor [Clostridiales bacterium]
MGGAICESYTVEPGAFETAGEASGRIKRILRKLGVPSALIRRVSVASYEVELNLVIHSLGGTIELSVEPDSVALDVADRGPGIPDLELAMREGWSTASDEVRTLGFGAGMGLPNMKRNADEFDIQSEMGVGTRIHMRFRSPEGTES